MEIIQTNLSLATANLAINPHNSNIQFLCLTVLNLSKFNRKLSEQMFLASFIFLISFSTLFDFIYEQKYNYHKFYNQNLFFCKFIKYYEEICFYLTIISLSSTRTFDFFFLLFIHSKSPMVLHFHSLTIPIFPVFSY